MLDMSKFHTFSFRGQKLSDFGALIAQRPTYPMSVASFELKEIPSKTGDVILNKSRIKNISFEIPIRFVPMACDSDIEKVANELSDWLYGTDYGEYRDTYHPGYYRRAIVTAIDDVIAVKRDVYETKITFNADPYLYLDSGKIVKSYNSKAYPEEEDLNRRFQLEASIFNPTKWHSEPIVTFDAVGGSSTYAAAIGGTNISINDNETGIIIIDKPNENVYNDQGVSKNDKISALHLPTLPPGESLIRVWSNAAFTLRIKPNWRRL